MDEEEDLPLHSELKFKKAPFFRRIKILGFCSTFPDHNSSEDVKPDIIFDIDIESEKRMQKNCSNNQNIPSQINDDNVIRIFKNEDFQTNSIEENVVQEDNLEYNYENMDYSPNQTLVEMKPVTDDNTKSTFKVHSDTPPATEEKLQFHICKYCSLIYKNKADYKKHLQEIHSEFQCETCVINSPDSCLIYNNQADYENHLQKVHTNGEKFKCGDCGFTSTSNVELWSHKIKTGHSADSTFQNKEGITKNKPGFLELRGSAPFGNKPTELVCQKCGFACESSDSIYNTIEFVTHLRMRHDMSTPYKCEKCDFICEEKPLIIDHMKSIHYYMPLSDNIVVVACQLCEFKIFSGINKKARLKLHLRKKHSQKKNQKFEKKYACYYCKKILTSQLSLEKHVRIVHDVPLEEAMKNCKSEVTVKNIVNDWENKVQCPYCDLLLRNNTELGLHLPRHTKEFYTCDKYEKCNFKTLSKKKFQNHEKKFHIDTNDWKCDQCDFRISYENHNFVLHNSASKGSIIKKYQRTLNQHKFMKHSIHFSNTDNCCNICDQICGSQRDLRLHLLKTHNISGQNMYRVPVEKATCHICNKVFTSRFHSLKHLKNEHGIVNNGVLCFKCGIVYTTADELENHQNEKHGKLDYICKFCDLNLNDLNGYNDHLKDNHKDYSKNFKCKLCKESSIIWHGVITLQLHYAENHNLHRKICEDCGAAVNSVQDLNKHKKAKIKEHVCEKCGKLKTTS